MKQRIEMLGYTEQYVAEQAGVSRAALNRWILGKANMSSARLEDICRFIGLGLVPEEDERFTLSMRVTQLERTVHRYENGPPRPSQLTRRRGRKAYLSQNGEANGSDES